MGDYYNSGSGVSQTLIEHWNGTNWSVVSSPNKGLYINELYGVAAVSVSNVWAVGYYSNSSNSPTQTLIEHWNGTSWSVVPSPNVGSSYNDLFGVAAVSASNIRAVGDYGSTLIEHWNGTSWSVVSSPNVGSNDNDLFSIATVSASNVWAVGYYYNNSLHDYQTLTEHWNGTNWSIVPSPDEGSSSNVLNGVEHVPGSSDVWAVGDYTQQTLIEFYC